MEFLADTPQPPYYAVIFSSVRDARAGDGYGAMAERMVGLAREQPGFLGVESVRDGAGHGITVSYWDSLAAIGRWGAHVGHRVAQAGGRERWYRAFRLRIGRVESDRRHERGE